MSLERDLARVPAEGMRDLPVPAVPLLYYMTERRREAHRAAGRVREENVQQEVAHASHR